MKPTSRLLLTLVTLALLPCLTLNVFGAHIATAVPLPATLDQLVNVDGTNKASGKFDRKRHSTHRVGGGGSGALAIHRL